MGIDEIIENFQFLEDWEDRYKYLIELGATLTPLPREARTRENKVRGCVSQVWVISAKSKHSDPILTFTGESDAHIVRGLIAVAFALFSNRPASEIVACDEKPVFKKIGLSEHITPQRANGLRSLIERIKSDARASLQA